MIAVQLVMEIQMEKLLRSIGKEDDFSRWKVLRSMVEKKLQTVSNYFPHFSRHDKTHSEQIAIQVVNLLGNERVEKLSATDLMMLLLAIYYHDIGMALEYEELREECSRTPFKKFVREHLNDDTDLGKSSRLVYQIDFNRTIDANVISWNVYCAVLHIIEDMSRSGHARRSGQRILRDGMLESLLGLRLRRTLAQICEMHQKDVSAIMELNPVVNGLYGDFMHPRFIASMLLLGDLLDLDSDRFDEVALKSATPLPDLSLIHKKKHEFVQSYLVQDGEIKLIFDANDVVDANGGTIVEGIKIYREMKRWCDWIKKACDFFSLHWGEIIPAQAFGNAPRFSECILMLRGERHYSELLDLSYMISGNRIFDLIKGRNIYKNKFACIREIIQNAVDATILRLFMEEILPLNDEDGVRKQLSSHSINLDDYKVHGEIQVKKDSEGLYVEVAIRDYGTGVSELDIKKIARIDNKSSKIREDAIQGMPVWFRPSGVFGLGLQSIFLLTSQFEMITKTMDEPPRRIVFYAPEKGDNGYIDVSRYKKPWKQGTRVSFRIERKKLQANDIGCSDYYFSTDKYVLPLLEIIRGMYGNMNLSRPVDLFRQEKYDYIPVVLEETWNEIPVKDKRIFCQRDTLALELNEPSIGVADGRMSVETFVLDTGCYIWCDILLEPEYRGGDQENGKDDHLYRTVQHLHHMRYGNSVFFRNIYVRYDASSRIFPSKSIIPAFIDWRINLLSDDADKVLSISRDRLQDNYRGLFRDKLENSIQKTMKKGIDYLLAQRNPEIKDTILLFYEAAIQYGYCVEQLQKLYSDVLKNIHIGGYYIHDTKQERKFTPLELRRKTMCFFIANISLEHLSSASKDLLEKEAEDISERECYDNKPEALFAEHILSHCPIRYFVGRQNDKFSLLVEAIPLEIYRPNEFAIEIKSMFLFRYAVLSSFRKRYRGFYVLRGYEKLGVSLDWDFSNLEDGLLHRQEYFINLPIEEVAQELIAALHENGYVANAELRFFDRIKKSDAFLHGVDYVCSRNRAHREEIVEMYEQLIQKILVLLADSNYKEENIRIMKQIDSDDDKVLINYNDLKYSPYMSV